MTPDHNPTPNQGIDTNAIIKASKPLSNLTTPLGNTTELYSLLALYELKPPILREHITKWLQSRNINRYTDKLDKGLAKLVKAGLAGYDGKAYRLTIKGRDLVREISRVFVAK